MGSKGARGLVAVLAVGAAVALFIVMSGDDEDSSPATTAVTTDETGAGGGGKAEKPEKAKEPPVPTIEIRGGQPVGGVQELEFESGGRILFRVSSDQPAEFHLHGYDVVKQVAAGGEVTYDLPAEIEGVFEFENHDNAAQLAEISVIP